MYILFAGNKYYSCEDIASASIKIITNNLNEIFDNIVYQELDEIGYIVNGFKIDGLYSNHNLNNGIYDWLEVFDLNTKTIIFNIDNTDTDKEFTNNLCLLNQLKNTY